MKPILSLLALVSCVAAGCASDEPAQKEDPKPTHEEVVASEKERCATFCRGECARLKAFGGPAEGTESEMIAAAAQDAQADQLKRLCACECETEQVEGEAPAESSAESAPAEEGDEASPSE